MAIVREEVAQAEIRGFISCNPAVLALAKGFVRSRARKRANSRELIDAFPREAGILMPSHVVLHDDRDIAGQFETAARWVSHRAAVAQALLELVGTGELMVASGGDDWWTPNVPTTTNIGSGGTTGGLSLDEFAFRIPGEVMLSPYLAHFESEQPATVDVFLAQAGAMGAHAEIIEALTDATRCFRAALYLPAVVMLGKAAEGAWKEALRAATQHLPPAQATKLKTLVEGAPTFADLLKRAPDALCAAALQPRLGTAALNVKSFDSVLLWSEALRSARNTVHYGVGSTVPNTYEKAAVLFLAGVDALATLFKTRSVLDP